MRSETVLIPSYSPLAPHPAGWSDCRASGSASRPLSLSPLALPPPPCSSPPRPPPPLLPRSPAVSCPARRAWVAQRISPACTRASRESARRRTPVLGSSGDCCARTSRAQISSAASAGACQRRAIRAGRGSVATCESGREQ